MALSRINLGKIIADSGIDANEISKILFPENKFPRLALNRVISGESTLNEDQISRLVSFTGMDYNEIFNTSGWLGVKSNNRSEMVFENGYFRAKLDTNNWTVKIFHRDSLYHETAMLNKYITISEFFKTLDSIINKIQHEEDSN